MVVLSLWGGQVQNSGYYTAIKSCFSSPVMKGRFRWWRSRQKEAFDTCRFFPSEVYQSTAGDDCRDGEKRLRRLSSQRDRKITHTEHFGSKQYFGYSVHEVFGVGRLNHLNANSAAVSLCDYKSAIMTVMEVITFMIFLGHCQHQV